MTEQEFRADEARAATVKSFLDSQVGKDLLELLEAQDPAAGLTFDLTNIPAAVAETQGSALLLGASSKTRQIINLLKRLGQAQPHHQPQSNKLGGEPPSTPKPPPVTRR